MYFVRATLSRPIKANWKCINPLKTAEMYYEAYGVNDKEAYMEAFHRDGLVVIENVLSSEECAASVAEVWDYLEKDGQVKRDEPNTWSNEHWPREICRNGGFMGRFPYWKRMKKLDNTFLNKQPQAWRNRENPFVHDVFQTILKTPKLWMSIDRYE